jgi:hypothetical protein
MIPISNRVGSPLGGESMATYSLGSGVKVHTYKNVITRRYLNIDGSGQCYRYIPQSEYIRISIAEASAWAFS